MSDNYPIPLHIYKASAGSGKTFTLAVEYIKLLIKDPNNYRHILAVTFTNKATEEMKMRILAQLFGISKGLDSSQPYLQKIARETGKSIEEIRQKSAEALHLLLHDYDFFRIETIDSFFQRIFRNLAHELDLTPNLRIDLNDGRVLEEAVDCIVKESADNHKTRALLLKFIEEAIADDHSWNIISYIKNFGKNIFRDFYKDNRDAISSAIPNINNVEKNLRQIITDFEQKMDWFVEDYESKKTKSNKNIDGYFKKLRERRYTKKDNLRNKTVNDNPEIFEAPETYRQNHLADYLTAKIALKNLPQLALLQEIGSKVNELNAKADRFLLSDTQNILGAMISSDANTPVSNAPFIYEKIGARLHHIMIDEFQDTSLKQWQNFKVLLDDCISQINNSSLIVGDIKQSIYRWRSGDWRLLHGLENEYTNMAKVIPLDTNYRSSQTVVDFNNDLFKEIVKQAGDIVPDYAPYLQSAYSDVEQKTKKDAGDGYIKIDFLDKDRYFEKTMESIHSYIVELKDKGYKENDIAILLRGNDSITKIADYFTSHYNDITIISDEAFKLNASKSVSIIIQAIRYLVQGDDISLSSLIKLYQNFVQKADLDENCLLIDQTAKDRFLPDGFISSVSTLKEMPLYELTETLYSIFRLSSLYDEGAYVSSFFDVVLNYVKNGPASLKRFIADWDADLHKKTIQTDSYNGVRLMTIHKSKGLEFPHVIIPFCDWRMEKAGNTIWVRTADSPMFCGFPVVPVSYSQTLLESNFADAYKEEHFQNIVDNINLLYVAFTRARTSLHVITRADSHTDMISIFLLKALKDSPYMTGTCYERGTIPPPASLPANSPQQPSLTVNPFEQQSYNLESENLSPSLRGEAGTGFHAIQFNQSNESNIFARGSDDETHDISRERGILLHNIFSSITTTADAPKVLDHFERQGLLCPDLLTRQEAQSYIDKCFSNPTMRQWFSPEWHICNERDILASPTLRRRCDRIVFNDDSTIVLDFKFGKHESKYITQVREYMSLLARIDFKNIRGFLWYAEDNMLEEVS